MSKTISHFACKFHFNHPEGCTHPNCQLAHKKWEYTGPLSWRNAISQSKDNWKKKGMEKEKKGTRGWGEVKTEEVINVWNTADRKKTPCRWHLVGGCKNHKKDCPFAHDKNEYRGTGDWEMSCQSALLQCYNFKHENPNNPRGMFLKSEFRKLSPTLKLERKIYAKVQN